MFRLTIAAALLAASIALIAAQAQPFQDQMAAGRTNVELKRQAVVSANLPLTAQESQAFWPLYHEYRTAVARRYDRGSRWWRTTSPTATRCPTSRPRS